jgi:TonB-linked SusC/RagA family outer membrane protein
LFRLVLAGAISGAASTQLAAQVRREARTASLTMAAAPRFFVETKTGIVPLDVASTTLLRNRIQVDFDSVPVRQAVNDIAAKAGIRLMYLDSVIPDTGSIRLRADGITVAAALTDVLDGTGVDIVFTSAGSISLVQRPRPPKPRAPGIVSGMVKDERGLGIPSVNVVVEGTQHGAVTGGEGSYRISDVPPGRHFVVARRLGYQPSRREVSVPDGGNIAADFTLEVSATSLSAMVVTGTAGGTQRKAVGNVVATVDAKAALDVAPVSQVTSLIGFQSPGVSVASSRGEIGAGGTIRIRGASTLGLKSDPLVYIDGVRMNSGFGGPGGDGGATVSRLNDINPQDIQSIEIIKGPAAATLYGTEASAGVIQILTKRGTQGAPQFEYSVAQGTTWFQDPAGTVGTSYGLDSTGKLVSVNLYEHEKQFGLGPVFQNGRLANYSMQVAGGTPQVRYFASANLDDQSGIVKYNWLKGWSTRANLSVLPRNDVTFTLNTAFVRSTNEKWQGSPDDVYRNLIWGGPSRLNTNTRGFARIAPEAFENDRQLSAGVNRIITSFTTEHIPVSWFTQRLNAGLDVTHEKNTQLIRRSPQGALGPFAANSLGNRLDADGRYEVKSVDYSATVNHNFTSAISSASSVGAQYFRRAQYVDTLSGTQFPAPGFETIGSMAVRTSSQTFVENITAGTFVQQQFGMNERLFVTGAIRGDANSSFGKKFKAAYYPKFSATWVLTEEPFWAEVPRASWVNQLRLRTAWGAAGRQPDAFAASRLYGGVTGPGDLAGVTPTSFGNPELKPERSTELELGFDAGFFNDRIQFGYTHFDKDTRDAIVPAPVAPSAGIPGTQVLNVGRLSNWGHEFMLKAEILDRENLKWEVNTQTSLLRDRVEDLGALTSLPVGDSRAATFHRVGYPSQSIFAQRILSATLNPDGSTTNEMCDGGTGRDGIQPGGALVPCAGAPLIYWGRGGNPTWEAALASTVTLWGNLRLQQETDARGGLMLDDDDIAVAATTFNNTSLSNLRNNAVYQAYRKLGRAPIGFTKGGFARLRNVSATYTLPQAWASKVKDGSRASVTVSGRNLALLWQEQTHVVLPDGSVIPDPKVRDPERRLTTEVGTFQQAQVPPLASVLVTLRMSF